MLPRLGETSSGVSRRGRVLLIILGLAALAAPLVYLSHSRPAVADDGATIEEEFLPPLSESEKKITAELDLPTVVEFNETPLFDATEYLKDLHGIEIQLDQKALDDAGIDSEVRMTCSLKGISLRSALRRMLSNLEMTYIVDDDMLLLTTTEKASVKLVTRTYPIAGFVADGDFAPLTKVITDTVRPKSWHDNGRGSGSIAYVKTARSLVISQTHEAHDEILKLLRALRAARKAAGPSADVPAPSETPRSSGPQNGRADGGMF